MTERPIEKSYWVEDGILLAGEYPKSAASIKVLEDAGIVSFIDLTEGIYEPYDRLLENADRRHFPIKDYDVPKSKEHTISILDAIDDNLRDGKPTYIHCYGGRGRTGTIIGCWLARHGHQGEAALEKLRELWAQNPKSKRGLQTPETPEQEQYIVEWKE